LTARFRPSRWLRSGHVQTLRAVLPPPRSIFARIRAEPIRLTLPDGNALIARASWNREARPTAVLVHGVGGSSESPYMLRAWVAFLRAGYHVVRLNLRGAGEGVEHATSIYHAGLTRRCKLYDYDSGCWLDYDGLPTTTRHRGVQQAYPRESSRTHMPPRRAAQHTRRTNLSSSRNLRSRQ
jgi:pimeloyl-ACP methyl ester carboxylesterase